MKADIGIHFIITIFTLFESWIAAIDIPYEDLNNPYKLCLPQSSCAGVDQKAAAAEAESGDGVGGLRRNCLCDDRCAEFGDCCTDSAHFDPVEQQNSAARHGCVLTDVKGGAYVVHRCPAAWTNARVRDACQAADGGRRDGGMVDNPVTSRTTGRAYRNRFCAACNDDAADPILWDTRIVCDSLTDVAAGAEQTVLDTLKYNATAGRWTVRFAGSAYECDALAVPPTAARARPCLPEAVVACHPKWPRDEIRSNCEAYTTVVYDNEQPYKNIHCAICNHVLVQNVSCQPSDVHLRFPNQFGVRSFTALFVARPGHRECRGPDTFYDPFGKTCRSLSVTDDGVPLDCPVVAMYPAPAEGWRPPDPDVRYVTLDNGTVAVCADADRRRSSDHSGGYVALTYAGLGVSAVLLVVHLAVFAALPEMKNLSGKNLASFCVSLLCSYAAFVAGNWLTGAACYAGAAVTYYAFLTSFAWMLVMSFDCWRTLRLATVELRVTGGRQTKKFLVYSAVCWLVPAMMTFVAVAADAVPAVPDHFRPRFGADQCWFGSKTALLMFFAGPLTAVMVVDVVLFGWTAYMIHSSRATVRHVNTRHVRRDFRMYCRLAVLMGLTWTTGIAASYTDAAYMWMLFVALNTFQGLFVFVAFTCRRRVLDSLVRGVGGGAGAVHLGLGHRPSDEKSKDGDRKSFHRGPPLSSFSWSSSDNGTPISSEKTTDTFY